MSASMPTRSSTSHQSQSRSQPRICRRTPRRLTLMLLLLPLELLPWVPPGAAGCSVARQRLWRRGVQAAACGKGAGSVDAQLVRGLREAACPLSGSILRHCTAAWRCAGVCNSSGTVKDAGLTPLHRSPTLPAGKRRRPTASGAGRRAGRSAGRCSARDAMAAVAEAVSVAAGPGGGLHGGQEGEGSVIAAGRS